MVTEDHTGLKSNKNKGWVYLCFWILVTTVFLYDTRYLIDKASLPYFLVSGAVRVGMLITVGWINVAMLVPRFLLRRRYFIYAFWVLVLILVYLLVQSLYDTYVYGFIIGGRRSSLASLLLYNFTHTSLYLVLTLALKFSIDWYEQAKLLQQSRVKQLQAEVGYLRSQLNPHFLFNALNNLYALTLRKSDNAPDVVLKLSEMMEYMLYESGEEMVAFDKELQYVRNFIELEQLRQEQRADISIEASGAVGRCKLPPFILLTLVENAFKHGISKMNGTGFLHIYIAVGSVLDCKVENNKPTDVQAAKKAGIGLDNLEKRLQLVYAGRHRLVIQNLDDRFIVHLQIEGTW